MDYLQLPFYICTSWASTIFTDKSILPTLSNQYLGWQGLTRRILSQQGWKTNTTNITTTSPISRLWCEMSARSLTPHQMLVLLHNLQQKLPTVCTETISVSVAPCQYIIYIKVINPRFRLCFIVYYLNECVRARLPARPGGSNGWSATVQSIITTIGSRPPAHYGGYYSANISSYNISR